MWQSIKFERELYKSEVHVKSRRQKEEKWNMARMQRKGSTQQDSDNREGFQSLEARVF
jgi:hypothetical protein